MWLKAKIFILLDQGIENWKKKEAQAYNTWILLLQREVKMTQMK